jgi:hypothetical protein
MTLMDLVFIKIGILPRYMGNYTGTCYEIKLSDYYNKRKANHEQCTQTFQKFIIGLLCIMSSGLGNDSTKTGFSLDFSDTKNLELFTKITDSLLDTFKICKYEFYFQLVVIRTGKNVLNNIIEEDTKKGTNVMGSKSVKTIPQEYIDYSEKVAQYFTEFETNFNRDNEESTKIFREIVLFNLKGVLNKDNFYRKFLLDYELEMIAYMDEFEDVTYTINFDGVETSEEPCRKGSKGNIFNW